MPQDSLRFTACVNLLLVLFVTSGSDLQQPICCILGITRGVELHRIVTSRHCTTSLGDGESHRKEHSPIQRFHP